MTKPAGPLYVAADPSRNGSQLASSVSAAIEDEIIGLGWPVGEVIGTEAELVARFGISSPVLRQAAGILESHQVARMRRGPGGGLVVTAPDERSISTSVALYLEFLRADPRLVSEARASVELACVELAAQRIRDDDVPRLRELVAAEPERGRKGEFDCLKEVHLAIAELSGNPVLALFSRMLMSLLSGRAGPRRGRRPGDHLEDLERAHEEHCGIVEALAGGDAALARLRMLRHLETARYDSPWWREPPST
jgi:DNA-binding FadR family transcriptional regulator